MIRLLEELRRSLRLVVGKCVLSAMKQGCDGNECNLLLLGSDRHSGVRALQHYGFASVAPDGSDAVALFVGGSRDNGVVVAEQGAKSDIPQLNKGETALFSKFGQKIILKNDGSISVVAADGKSIVFNSKIEASEDIVCEKSITAGEDVSAAGDVVAHDSSLPVHLSTHTHLCASPGEPSGPPEG